MSIPANAHWKMHPDDSIVVTDLTGDVISMVAPPWAKDASGSPVPTTFDLDGHALTQQGSADSGQYAYRIVADPFQGKRLFKNLNPDKRHGGQVVYSGTKMDWGQKIHNGQAGDAAGRVGGLVTSLGEERFSRPDKGSKNMSWSMVSLRQLSALLIALGAVTYLVGGVLSFLEYQALPEPVRADTQAGPIVATVIWTGIGLCAVGVTVLCAAVVRRVRRRRQLR